MNIPGPAFGLIVIVVLMCCATVIVMASLATRFKQRELQHRERLAAIEKGAALPVLEETAAGPLPFNPRAYLLRGLVWLFIGIGIVVSLGAVTMFSKAEKSAYERVSQANLARASGATDEQVRMILNDRRRDGPGPGVALIGLIPLGVGLAYLITWRSERRTGWGRATPGAGLKTENAHASILGSLARGEAGPASDVDVLVELDDGHPMGMFEYARLRLYIDDILEGGADVANRRTLKPMLRDRILNDAVHAFWRPCSTAAVSTCSSRLRQSPGPPRRSHRNRLAGSPGPEGTQAEGPPHPTPCGGFFKQPDPAD